MPSLKNHLSFSKTCRTVPYHAYECREVFYWTGRTKKCYVILLVCKEMCKLTDYKLEVFTLTKGPQLKPNSPLSLSLDDCPWRPQNEFVGANWKPSPITSSLYSLGSNAKENAESSWANLPNIHFIETMSLARVLRTKKMQPYKKKSAEVLLICPKQHPCVLFCDPLVTSCIVRVV